MRQTEIRGNMLYLSLPILLCSPNTKVVWKGFIKSPCLFVPAVAHIQGCDGESAPLCWGLYLHLWFLWGSAFVLRICHGWGWCYEGVGGSLCRKCSQESITSLLRARSAAFLIRRHCKLLLLLLPPLPLCWHHLMFTGPHSDPSQWNELN